MELGGNFGILELVSNKIIKRVFVGVILSGLSVILCVCVCLSLLPCGAIGTGDGSVGVCEFFLAEAIENEGVFEVVVSASAEVGMCGLLLDVAYDSDKLVLLSAGAECGDAVFSYFDAGGEVRLLIDSVYNFDRAEVSLFFVLSEEARGEAEVRFSDAEAMSLRGGRLLELGVEILNREIGISCAVDDGAEDKCLPLLVSSGWSGGRYHAVLSVAESSREGYFAAGAELFFVRYGGVGEKIFVSRVIPPSGEGEVEISVPFDGEGLYAVIITPMAFKRGVATRGEKVVAVGRAAVEPSREGNAGRCSYIPTESE